MKLVCFRLQDQEFGADIAEIKETLPLCPLTPVFLTPAWLAGIMNLRGDVVAVLDLALLLGMARAEVSERSRIVIATAGGRTAGLLVDRLAELRTVDPDRIEPPPATLPASSSSLLWGVTTTAEGRALRVLDLAALLDSEPLRAFRRSKR